MKIKTEKAKFFQTEIDFLGFWLSPNGISSSRNKIESIEKFPTPKNLAELQRFLGLCAFYKAVLKEDDIFVSFDVVAMYTNISVQTAVDTVMNKMYFFEREYILDKKLSIFALKNALYSKRTKRCINKNMDWPWDHA